MDAPTAVEGIVRFLRRLWRVVHEVAERRRRRACGEGALARKANETIAQVTDDIGRRFQFHTPISALMELVNELGGRRRRAGRALRGRDGGVA